MKEAQMKENYLFFKGGVLMQVGELAGRISPKSKDVQERTGISYPTCLLLTSQKRKKQTQAFERLFLLLTEGFGFSPEELAELKFTDVFEIVSGDQIISGATAHEISDRLGVNDAHK